MSRNTSLQWKGMNHWTETQGSLDGSQGNYTKWKKSILKCYILYNSTPNILEMTTLYGYITDQWLSRCKRQRQRRQLWKDGIRAHPRDGTVSWLCYWSHVISTHMIKSQRTKYIQAQVHTKASEIWIGWVDYINVHFLVLILHCTHARCDHRRKVGEEGTGFLLFLTTVYEFIIIPK